LGGAGSDEPGEIYLSMAGDSPQQVKESITTPKMAQQPKKGQKPVAPSTFKVKGKAPKKAENLKPFQLIEGEQLMAHIEAKKGTSPDVPLKPKSPVGNTATSPTNAAGRPSIYA